MAGEKRINDQWNIVMIIMLIATLVLAITSRVISNRETADLLKWISIGLMACIFISRVFKGRLGSKPTREDLEKKVFGNEKQGATLE